MEILVVPVYVSIVSNDVLEQVIYVNFISLLELSSELLFADQSELRFQQDPFLLGDIYKKSLMLVSCCFRNFSRVFLGDKVECSGFLVKCKISRKRSL